jgi:two-component system, OmpR family, response regulator RegX3
MTRVLVVEDDESIVKLLSCLLVDEGFQPVVARTGPDALDVFDRVGAALVLLDLRLPGLSGIEVFQRLRRKSDVPVIIVTGKDDEVDRIVGLEMGADDYVTKPFSPRELIARIRAVLRRQQREASDKEMLTAGPVRMDVARHVVTIRGTVVNLPLKEFELLEVLLRNAGLVLPRMRLIEVVWGSDYVGDTKTLDVHIKRLRAKIEHAGEDRRHIITVRGLGYKFEADPRTNPAAGGRKKKRSGHVGADG